MTLLLVLLLPLLFRLGFWQLDRAAEKQAYENAYLQRQGMLAIDPPAQPLSLPYARVRLDGHYDNEAQYLLDNQIREGQVGYWTITRFVATDGRSWLVNRGWVAAGSRREILPDITISEDPVTIVAVIWPDTGLPPLLAEDKWDQDWPLRIQRLNIARMAAQLESTEAVELRLEEGQPGVLAPAPLLIHVRASKNIGYAVQWFGLAAVLTIGFIVYGFRRKAG